MSAIGIRFCLHWQFLTSIYEYKKDQPKKWAILICRWFILPLKKDLLTIINPSAFLPNIIYHSFSPSVRVGAVGKQEVRPNRHSVNVNHTCHWPWQFCGSSKWVWTKEARSICRSRLRCNGNPTYTKTQVISRNIYWLIISEFLGV